jgi:predicted phosphodiesterase
MRALRRHGSLSRGEAGNQAERHPPSREAHVTSAPAWHGGADALYLNLRRHIVFIPPIRTVRAADHSLFQSAVAAHARSQPPGSLRSTASAVGAAEGAAAAAPQAEPDAFTGALGTHLVEAASAAARAAAAGQAPNPAALLAAAPGDTNAAAGAPAFPADQAPNPRMLLAAAPDDVNAAVFAKALGEAMAAGDEAGVARLTAAIRKFSSADWAGWLTCAEIYAKYLLEYGTVLYRDWRREGKGDPNYSVIQWKLPNNARVGILGDWGTNMDDARAVLSVMKQKGVDAVIHLGDIYYSGTPDESNRALRILRDVLGPGIPVFNLPGNHDYYAFGHGFYPMLDALNAGIPEARQAASYFCLRTEDGAWQFLGMDTGYNDSNPVFQRAPALVPSEADWHREKLETFGGKTILLSHHQLFSAGEEIRSSARPWLNEYLLGVFQPYFRDRVAAWLWGHEHNLVLYADGIMGLQKGRLIGASAYEEALNEDPYKVKYPQIPYLHPSRYRLDATEGYYNHSYAIIDLGVRKAPQDPVSITYYQYPSWSGVRASYPLPPKNETIFTESLDVHPVPPGAPVQANTPVRLRSPSGFFISAMHEEPNPVELTTEYYPHLSTTSSVRLSLVGAQGVLRDGATVFIQTTEAAVGAYNQLGAWRTPSLYYYKPGYDQERWIIHKRVPGDGVIRYGDDVWFENVTWKQWLTTDTDEYLTTAPNANYYWTIQP